MPATYSRSRSELVELIDSFDHLDQFVVAKLRVTGNRKTSLGVQVGIAEFGRSVLYDMAKSLAMRRYWIMNRCLHAFTAQEFRQPVSLDRANDE